MQRTIEARTEAEATDWRALADVVNEIRVKHGLAPLDVEVVTM